MVSHQANDKVQRTDGAVAAASRPEGSLSERVRSLRLPTQSRASGGTSKTLAWIFGLLCLVLCAGVGYLMYGLYQNTQKLDEAASDPARLVEYIQEKTGRTVDLRPPESAAGKSSDAVASSGNVGLESKGYVTPVHRIKVSPKVAGMVVKLNIEEGQHVEKGDVLAVLETTDYKAEYDRAVATANASWQRFLELYVGSRPEEIKQAKAQLEEMEANRDRLQLEYKRNTRLQGRDAVAMRDYEQAVGDYKAMERRVEQMRYAYELMLMGPREEKVASAWAEVEQAEADLAKAKWRLDSCTVTAPVSGTILTKTAELGNIVNPIAMNIATAFCEMADLSDLEVNLDIQERDIANVFKGQRCRIKADAYADRYFDGVVSRVMPEADQGKGAIPVRVKINLSKEEEGILKPNMACFVYFLKKEEPEKSAKPANPPKPATK